MKKQEIKHAITNKTPLIWNDPNPIEGNDYTINSISDMDEETAIIQYGGASEAEVYLTEITTQ